MEVRLSEFAEIVGVASSTIRNAIHHNKLPFLDTQRKTAETEQKLARRTYSVADAFCWYLQDLASSTLAVGPWMIANSIRRAHTRVPVGPYIDARLAGESRPEVALFIGRGVPVLAADGLTEADVKDAFVNVGGSDGLSSIREKYPVHILIYLDPVFDSFVTLVRQRGWAITEEGFTKIETGEA